MATFPLQQPVPLVDQVGVDERAAKFTKRSIKNEAKAVGLKMAVSMMDLTTLEGSRFEGQSHPSLSKGPPSDGRSLRLPAVRCGLRLSESRRACRFGTEGHGEFRSHLLLPDFQAASILSIFALLMFAMQSAPGRKRSTWLSAVAVFSKAS